jgi:hypothetical protein
MIEVGQLRSETNLAEGAAVFSAEGLALLRAALQPQWQWNDEKLESSPTLRMALRRICWDAKSSNARPERFLVAFKNALQSAPALRRLARGPERDEYIARIVSLCIGEYYRDTTPEEVATAERVATL